MTGRLLSVISKYAEESVYTSDLFTRYVVECSYAGRWTGGLILSIQAVLWLEWGGVEA